MREHTERIGFDLIFFPQRSIERSGHAVWPVHIAISLFPVSSSSKRRHYGQYGSGAHAQKDQCLEYEHYDGYDVSRRSLVDQLVYVQKLYFITRILKTDLMEIGTLIAGIVGGRQ